jgi:hypothetical protein
MRTQASPHLPQLTAVVADAGAGREEIRIEILLSSSLRFRVVDFHFFLFETDLSFVKKYQSRSRFCLFALCGSLDI